MSQNYTADTIGPQIVQPGGCYTAPMTYKGDGSATFVKGDLCRITTSGQVKDIATDSDTAGSVHGMILTDDHKTTAATTSQYVPIMVLAPDTVLKMQCYHATPASALPSSFVPGVAYELRNGAAGCPSVTLTSTKGVATCVAIPGTTIWFDDQNASSDQYGFVYVKFETSVLDGNAA